MQQSLKFFKKNLRKVAERNRRTQKCGNLEIAIKASQYHTKHLSLHNRKDKLRPLPK